jgi:hypothetical protein
LRGADTGKARISGHSCSLERCTRLGLTSKPSPATDPPFGAARQRSYRNAELTASADHRSPGNPLVDGWIGQLAAAATGH